MTLLSRFFWVKTISPNIKWLLSPAHTVRFWPRFGRLRQILKILKDSCNPRLKSVVFDRWFDMSTDSRLMAVAIHFFLRLNSGSVRRFQTLSCSVTSPTTTVKPRTNMCAEPDDAISATTSNHENVETSQVDSTTVQQEKLIELWREKECLYDVSSQLYHDRVKKEAAWREIGCLNSNNKITSSSRCRTGSP